MKTAISLPDAVFAEAERFARRTKVSRSRLYSEAVREYVARHSPEQVTEAMDAVVRKVGARPDRFATAAAHRVLKQTEW